MLGNMKAATAGIALVAGLALAPGTAMAQQTINITAISGYAPTASWVRVFEEFFIPEVDRLLAEDGEYQINWNRGFSGTIVRPREELEAVADGIGDIGIIVPPFHVDRVPLHNIAFVTPFATGDLHLVTRAYEMLAERFPAFLEEWSDLGIVYLGSSGTVDNYQAACRSNMPTPDSFEGVRVAGAGTNLLFFQGLGAVGISSNLGDYYNQLQTGIADCASIWAESVAGFRLYEVAPYFIRADLGAAVSFSIGANERFWERLPEPVRAAIEQASAGYGMALADYVVEASGAALETIEAGGGTITVFTQEQREEWANRLDNLAMQWAQEMDALGKPGTEMLVAYMDFLREHDQPIARHWDRE